MLEKISLVMATLGRFNEIDEMINTLSEQTYKNFELIIVDQNPKGFLSSIIEKYSQKIEIKYVHTTEKGLSRARNIGLTYVTGDYIGFPDDDCKYQYNTLETVVKIFKNPNIDAITGTITRDIDKKTGNHIRKVNIYDVWIRGISYTMFFKRKVINEIKFFDEILGVGSGTIYGSGEETDYLIRTIKKGFSLWNTDLFLVYHPSENLNNKGVYKKAYDYSKGRMYVLKKHNYNSIFILLNILYPLVKLFIYIYDFKKIKYHWYQFKGRLL